MSLCPLRSFLGFLEITAGYPINLRLHATISECLFKTGHLTLHGSYVSHNVTYIRQAVGFSKDLDTVPAIRHFWKVMPCERRLIITKRGAVFEGVEHIKAGLR